MASRAMREGSVGLMIVGGIALFAVLVGWLRDVQIGRRAYQVTVEFIDARGVQVGTAVNYRGVQVGKVRSITPNSQLVDVVIDISRLDVLIPYLTQIEAQSSALLGETALDIRPLSAAPELGSVPGPLDPDCDPQQILCDGSRLAGSTVADLTDLIRSLNELAALLNNPELLELVETVATNTVKATDGISDLTGDLANLSQSVQGEVGNLSTTLRSATDAAQNAGKAAITVDQTAAKLGGVANQASGLADRASGLTDQASRLATQTSGLVTQASGLIEENRGALNQALVNVSQAGKQVQTSLANLDPLVKDLNSRELVENLDQITQNARSLTANLRDTSVLLGDPKNILLLQQTLDAARVTFQNAQKLTSDLDEVTGDPEVRMNLRRLINGLSGLIASTQQLEQQVTVAQALSPQSSPQQIQALAQLNTEIDLISLGLMGNLAQLSQLLEAEGEPGLGQPAQRSSGTAAPKPPAAQGGRSRTPRPQRAQQAAPSSSSAPAVEAIAP
ncbi:MAG: MCE family protein [Synechococcales cyanobacterium RM1_1_8]|nr:MCE family protein [Synechococcales cyanobacterium RM1_1_8]